jgi:hypothetical protein
MGFFGGYLFVTPVCEGVRMGMCEATKLLMREF